MVAVPPRPVRGTGEMPKAAYYDKLRTKDRAALRRAYEEGQGGMCYHCKMPLAGPPPDSITRLILDTSKFPTGFFHHMVHLHHDHQTGLTLGAVHSYCNAVLWQYHGE